MIRRLLLAVALLATVATPTLGADPAHYKTRNVIVAVMDGVRYSETFGDPARTLIPNLATMEKEGTLFTDFRIAGPGISVTRQGHSTISTGTWQTVALGGARMTMPTFFEYARNELGWKQTDCWCVFGKGKYAFADFSSFPGYGENYRPWFINSIGETELKNDDAVLDAVFAAMDKDKPHLIFINFGYTDHIAHVSTFDKHQVAIRHCDEIFGRLWKKVQSTPGYKDQTTVFFTNDHGRHNNKPNMPSDGFKDHGDKCDGCRHIMLLAVGPDIKRGVKVDRKAQQIDICPTVGELLGFQTPFADGKVMADCLTKPLGLNAKAARTAAARDGARLIELSKRDMLSTIAKANLSRDLDSLKPSVGTELLMRGMISASMAMSTTKDNEAYLKFVEKWVARNSAAAASDAHVARVMLELRRAREKAPAAYDAKKVRQCAEKIAKHGATGDEQSKLMAAAFVAKAGVAFGSEELKNAAKTALGLQGKTEQELVTEWRKLGIPNTPMACDLPAPVKELTTMTDAIRLLALADAAEAMPGDRVVRLACNLQGCTCSRGRPELGANWSDPAMSAVIIGSLISANHVEPAIDWVKSEPAQAQMAAGATPGKKNGKPGPPRWATPIRAFYFDSIPWQMMALAYEVSAKGHFAKGDPLSDGAAMLMEDSTRGQYPVGNDVLKTFSN